MWTSDFFFFTVVFVFVFLVPLQLQFYYYGFIIMDFYYYGSAKPLKSVHVQLYLFYLFYPIPRDNVGRNSLWRGEF